MPDSPVPPAGPVPAPPALPRVGVGVDVHSFAADGRALSLAGLTWPGERGLAGHSDADVAAHAACDALFSAAGIGDLGTHFGTDRPGLADAAGVTLLAQAAQIVTGAGYVVGNISIQIVGNRPKLGPRREEAEAVLSAAVAAPVSVSATTTDGLGLTGRGEGIAAIATAIVFRAP
jgi:2-C-methyl-D-erythritol 2,4-cyclodiphosphate synthase